MKHFVPILLVLSLLIGALFVVAPTVSAERVTLSDETDDVGEWQVISTASEFLGMEAGKNYILSNDIDFGGLKATSALVTLRGTMTLDGNGYSLTGYSLEGESDLSTFVVATGANITLKNLKLGSSTAPLSIHSEYSGKSIGAVFGYANCTFTLQNVTAWVEITSVNSYVGGLLGNCQGTGVIMDCVCYGSIDNGTATGARGGIIGQISTSLQATLVNCFNYASLNYGGYNVGGIAGRIVSGKSVLLSGCVNYGALRSTKYAGGIVGQIQPSKVSVDYSVESCCNYGSVTGGTQSGGLFGDIGYATSVNGGALTVTDCTNYGTVSGEDDMSGIAGRLNCAYPVTFQGCVNYGDITGTKNTAGLTSSAALGGQLLSVRNFWNFGTITAAGRGAGGVTGWLSAASSYEFSECVNLGTITGTVAGNLFSMTVGNLTVTDCCAFSTNLNSTSGTGGYVVGTPGEVASCSDIRYISGTAGLKQDLCGESMTMAEALNYLNLRYAASRVGFTLNTNGDAIISAVPKFAGVQEGAASDGKQTVCFIGVIQDSLKYSEVGFALTVNGTSFGMRSCGKVYEKMTVYANGTESKLSAKDLGGKYIYLLSLDNVPVAETVEIEVSPYAKNLDGTMIYFGASYLVVYENGVFSKMMKQNEEQIENLSVGTYNILHGKDYLNYLETNEDIIDLEKVADAIREMNVDICGLNEVRNQENVKGLCNQAKVIAEKLGYHYVFAKAINYGGGEYGNALITRYPILSSRVIPLVVPEKDRVEGQAYENRALLIADLLIQGRTVTVMVSHFGLHDDEMQLAVETIERFAKQCKNPLVLMGDFNFPPSSVYYQELAGFLQDTVAHLQGDVNTFPSNLPSRKIDYLFVNALCQVQSASVPEIIVSDHRPYLAKLTIA